MKRLAIVLAILTLIIPSVALSAGNEVFVIMGGYAAPSVGLDATNTSQVLTTAYDAASSSDPTWNKVRYVIIQALNNGAVIAVGADAVNGATQNAFTLTAGGTVVFTGETVRQLRFKNATDDSTSRLIILPQY